MIALTKAREAAGMNKRQLGAKSELHPSRISVIENGRAIPYDVELARIAAALGWAGDPATLLEEVETSGRPA